MLRRCHPFGGSGGRLSPADAARGTARRCRRRQQDDAGDDVLLPGAVLHEPHAVLDDGDDRAAEDRVEDPALAAEEAGAADDGRADGVEQHVAAAGVRVDRRLPRDAAMMPPTAAMPEQMTKTEMRIASTLMPARREASLLPPTAYTCRP